MENLHSLLLGQGLADAQGECVLLVHPSIAVLTRAVAQLRTFPGVIELNIGRHLSKDLLETPQGERPRAGQGYFYAALAAAVAAPGAPRCLLTHIDLLFEPGLGLDPLRLFQQAARRVPLIVLWPGTYTPDPPALSYAVPEHGHYRTWPAADITARIYRLND